MARKAFFSFHYMPDNWRASKVRNIGALEANQPVSDNDWEQVTKGGDSAIERWIARQMSGRSCVVVLVGANTAGRKWINYEIKKGWNDGLGLVGVHIHNLKDRNELRAAKGSNPFANFTVGEGKGSRSLSSVVQCYDPPYTDSQSVYNYIANNLSRWVEEAVRIRSQN